MEKDFSTFGSIGNEEGTADSWFLYTPKCHDFSIFVIWDLAAKPFLMYRITLFL